MSQATVVRLDDRASIERSLRLDPALHLYELGDLDDFFWPHTTWYALADGGAPRSIALLYTATELPVLVLLTREREQSTASTLLAALVGVLPERFYTHLSPGLSTALEPSFGIEPHGLHQRMVLGGRAIIDSVDTANAVPLGPADRDELLALYADSYPGNWFDPRMLETGLFFGVRRHGDGALISAAGVHVVSKRYRVAALGNVATAPSARGRGLGRIATAAVCKALLALDPKMDPIGLNVEIANTAAIRLYRTLGFENVATYEEMLCTSRA